MRECEVLVIGGGIAGASVLYHLCALGHSDVMLVEKDELTSGSTWHAAGLCTQFNGSAALMKLLRNSIDLYASLEAETDQAVDLHRCGSVRLACTRERLDEYRHRQGFAQSLGIPFEIISPERVVELFPLLDPKGLLGAAYLPSDGYVDPTSVTQALAKGAIARGAAVFRRTRVKAIERSGDRWEVDTSAGPIRAHTVVNAAGQWAPEISRMVGVALPIVPLEHHYLITEPLDAVRALDTELPVMRDVDASFYVREEGGGLLVGPFERQTVPWALDGIPDDFHSQLLPDDLGRLEEVLGAAARRIPVFGSAGIRTVLNGPDGYTPDGRCLMGPLPGCPNFHVLAGFSIFGIVFSGGAGRYAAEWITRGQPSDDLWELDVRRFDSAQAEPSYVAARACEVYGREYAIHPPNEEGEAARPLKRCPIYGHLLERGAVFGTSLGWERPLWFAKENGAAETPSFRRGPEHEAIGDECRAVRAGAGILDETSLAKFELSGAGAEDALERLCANRLPAPLDRAVRTPLCNALGGIECDLTVTRLARDRFFLVGDSAKAVHIHSWLDQQLQSELDLRLEVVTDAMGVFRIAGPRAREILADLCGEDIPGKRMTWRELDAGVAALRVLRLASAERCEFELHHPIASGAALYERIHEAGQARGLVDWGHRAYDSLRLESGVLRGVELSSLRNPLEARLGHHIDFGKGDFLGRAALLEARDVVGAERLYRLVVEAADADACGGEVIRSGGVQVGCVNHGGYAHCEGVSVAFSYLPPPLARAETAFDVQILGERYPARIAGPSGNAAAKWS